MATRLIVVAPTFYRSPNDTRYRLGVEACRNAAEHEIQLLLVDASPSEFIRDELRRAGSGFVTVIEQTSRGKKGAALREGIQKALFKLEEENDSKEKGTIDDKAVIAFQELEKVDMFRHWKKIVSRIVSSSSIADIVVPYRDDASFRETYPIEQYHCEKFANLYLDSLGSQIGMPSIDWTIGPVAFRSSLATWWLKYAEGEMWDAQLVPIVNCFVQDKAKIVSVDIPYRHPSSMKIEEEGNPAFNEKRLHQIKFLSDTVGRRIEEAISFMNLQLNANGGET